MLVRKIENGYQFESLTMDGAFIIKLTLTKGGKEKLETCPVGTAVSFPPRELPAGTIKKAVGPERWKNFLQMKGKGIATMFLEPHRGAPMPRTW